MLDFIKKYNQVGVYDVDVVALRSVLIAAGALAEKLKVPKERISILDEARNLDFWKKRLQVPDERSGLESGSRPSGTPVPSDSDTPRAANAANAANRPAELGSPGPYAKPLTQKQIQAEAERLAVQSQFGYAISGSAEVRSQLIEEKENTSKAAIPQPIKEKQIYILEEALRLNMLSKENGSMAVIKDNRT